MATSPIRNIFYQRELGESDIMFLTSKLERIDELEEKVEVLQAQKQYFGKENQCLKKQVYFHQNEAEKWKAKFYAQYNHSSQVQTQKKKLMDSLLFKDQENQVHIDKLLSEISRLQNEMANMEKLKQIKISTLKNKYESETLNQVHDLKNFQYGNNELQQLKIKKLKGEIEQKDHEIENLKRNAKLENERLIGEISYLKNQIQRIQSQKTHQLELIKTENENTKNNLIRLHKKNEEELKNLNEQKIKRLTYELEEKKNEIENLHGKAHKNGKQNEAELNNLIGQKNKLRLEMKENDNKNKKRMQQLTYSYEKQIQELRKNSSEHQKSLIAFYEGENNSLKEIIKAKQTEIERLEQLNEQTKTNEENRLADTKASNQNLKQKIQEIVKHYEREIQLMKIKISQLYEADLESLRSHMKNSFASHNRETEELRRMLDNLRDQLDKQIQDKMDLRADYENRLNEFKIIHEKEVQMLKDQMTMHQKNYEIQTSKASLTHISHTEQIQQRNIQYKRLIQQKRNLERLIENKNKEIEALNLQIQKLEGFHNKEIEKLEREIVELKEQHQKWLHILDKENENWKVERAYLKERVNEADMKYKEQVDATQELEKNLKEQLHQKNIQIGELMGKTNELNNKIEVLNRDIKISAESAEKTRLENQSLLNVEKQKYVETQEIEKSLRVAEAQRMQSNLQKVLDELKHENEVLRQQERQWKIREADMKTQIRNLLDSVNCRSQLEEHVINIGLSNNYFKNIAQIFKKQIPE